MKSEIRDVYVGRLIFGNRIELWTSSCGYFGVVYSIDSHVDYRYSNIFHIKFFTK